MRARYYSPVLRRFINADIIPGEISNAVTLNRYAYANGNPVSNIDPFGLSAEDKTKSTSQSTYANPFVNLLNEIFNNWEIDSNELVLEFSSGNITFYIKIEHSVGNGDVSLSDIIQEEYKFIASVDNIFGKISAEIDKNLTFKLSYAKPIDNMSSMGYASSVGMNGEISVETFVTSKIDSISSVTMTTGIKMRPDDKLLAVATTTPKLESSQEQIKTTSAPISKRKGDITILPPFELKKTPVLTDYLSTGILIMLGAGAGGLLLKKTNYTEEYQLNFS